MPVTSYLDGLRRVLRAPATWFSVWLLTVLAALPLALLLRDAVAGSLGASLAAESAARGVNWDWWQEFQQQATGLAATLEPSVIGFAAVLRNTNALLDARLTSAIGFVVGAWLLLWTFLSGGILDRYGRQRPTYASGFFAACGTHFFRFLRLAVLAGLAYFVLYGFVHPLLFETIGNSLTRDLSVERTAFFITMGMYLTFGLLLLAVVVVFDYARIRIVVEDRRSAIAALAASGRFVARYPGRVIGLVAVNALVFLVLAAIYALIAPGAPAPAWVALLVGELWILARVWVKLTFYASQVSLFQGSLAHAEYVATPVLEWPESPAAEAIRAEPPSAAVP
jgi:hypothetical protein